MYGETSRGGELWRRGGLSGAEARRGLRLRIRGYELREGKLPELLVMRREFYDKLVIDVGKGSWVEGGRFFRVLIRVCGTEMEYGLLGQLNREGGDRWLMVG